MVTAPTIRGSIWNIRYAGLALDASGCPRFARGGVYGGDDCARVPPLHSGKQRRCSGRDDNFLLLVVVAAAAKVEEEQAEGDQSGGRAEKFCEVEKFVRLFGGRD